MKAIFRRMLSSSYGVRVLLNFISILYSCSKLSLRSFPCFCRNTCYSFSRRVSIMLPPVFRLTKLSIVKSNLPNISFSLCRSS
jgi:hypothetical protein